MGGFFTGFFDNNAKILFGGWRVLLLIEGKYIVRVMKR